MLCEQCKQREATTHIKRVLNGAAEEFHLCGACAKEAGLMPGELFGGGFGLHLSDLFSGFLGSSLPQQTLAPAARCAFCGSTLREITENGRVGCAQCYQTFYEELAPSLQRIHSALQHNGKSPAADPAAAARKAKEQNLADLKTQIAQAIRNENYEEAARLRDEIRSLEEGSEPQC
jgi:protein arginine kinase activator